MAVDITQVAPLDVNAGALSNQLNVNVADTPPIGSVQQLTEDGTKPFPWVNVVIIVVVVMALAYWFNGRKTPKLTL